MAAKLFPEDMPEHLKQAVIKGGSARWGDEFYTAESMGYTPGASFEAAADSEARLNEARAVVEELESRLAKYEDEDGNPLAAPAADVKESEEYKQLLASLEPFRKVTEALMPSSESEWSRAPESALDAIAEFKGVVFEKGISKADKLAMLKPKESA